MSEQGTQIQATDEAESAAEDKPRRGRPRTDSGAGGFMTQLRALAESHRARLAKIIDEETKLAERLLRVRREREAAEAPLREVEATLARFPELGLEPEQEAAQ